MVDLGKCCECKYSGGGGYPEVGDSYTTCELLDGQVVFYEYGPIFEDVECPLMEKEFKVE